MRESEGEAGAAPEFDLFYVGTAPRIVRQLALLTGDLGEAEDVTQEAFERAWLHWSVVKKCASPEAWVRTVARRLAVSRWRRMRNASAAWLRYGPPPEPPELDHEHLALLGALCELPPKQRAAIVLHHLADLPVKQVAEETGSSESAVKQQLVRGRAAMAALLAENHPAATASPNLTLRNEEQ